MATRLKSHANRTSETMKLNNLSTPSLILDRILLEANTRRMSRRLKDHGVRFRPHMKTAKSIEVARVAIAGNFGGVMVSTLKEAEYFASHGISDITYGVTVLPDKLARIAELVKRGIKVSVILDQIGLVREVNRQALELGVVVDVLIELDSGEKRAGVLSGSEELLDIGRALTELPGTRLEGVLTHAGHSYHSRSIEDIRKVAEEERVVAVSAAEQLRAIGLAVPVVSVGSTPTATHGVNFAGVTEVRCGVYMFGDVMQSEIYSCGREDISLSVLATVIGHRPQFNTALVDAGALALSKDRSTAASGLAEDIGFGMVMDINCQERISGVTVGHVYQEHGLLVSQGPFPYEALPVGSKVRILPNHACMTAAMFDRYHAVAGNHDGDVVEWPRINGW
ncbi:alanine racemase [Mesorhizobium sp. WSM4976]|uniref:alanine racemase n=1 Tax=Mesorhizobium sp. WSM4976 TaxID=3038549 RepID=UPI002415FF3E|nr:alanine racemase [Mesorhizobium sp. WSM4976]MDG4895608.1 alanine racemase [Mesorhizobium sp. WSM4976]